MEKAGYSIFSIIQLGVIDKSTSDRKEKIIMIVSLKYLKFLSNFVKEMQISYFKIMARSYFGKCLRRIQKLPTYF